VTDWVISAVQSGRCGSMLPDEAEARVKYYLGVLKKSDGKSFGVVQKIDR
jgi:hypothetical protein